MITAICLAVLLAYLHLSWFISDLPLLVTRILKPLLPDSLFLGYDESPVHLWARKTWDNWAVDRLPWFLAHLLTCRWCMILHVSLWPALVLCLWVPFLPLLSCTILLCVLSSRYIIPK